MKNLVFKSLYMVLAAGSVLSMQSCNSVTVAPAEELRFNTSIELPGLASAATKAGSVVSKSTFAHSDQMGLWVVPFSATGETDGIGDVYTDLRPVGNYADNLLHTFAGAFTTATPVFYPTAKAKVDLYAVSPYDATMSAKVSNSMPDPKAFSFKIVQDQSVASGAAVVKSDIMTAFYRGAKQGANGTLAFRHRLSHVLIPFKLAATYKGQAISAVKSVSLCNVPLESMINITDTLAVPAVSTNNNPKVDVKAYAAIKPDYNAVAGDYTYEAIVTPGVQYLLNDVIVKVVLTVTSIGDVEFMCKASTAVTLEAKKQTNINIQFSDQSTIALADVTIQGWGAPTEVSATTSKHSNMLIGCADGTGTINALAVTAKLTIEGEDFNALATYDSASKRYRLQYDHKSNFGGYLTSVDMYDASGVRIFTATPPSGGLQIKGDPTADNYATVIGTMTFNADGEVSFQ